MAELRLKFTDERGGWREMTVATERFSIGRTPDNDLMIASSALSRKHAEITGFGEVFIVADLGSSNGTRLNDRELTKPSALRDGDKLTLGDAVEIQIEITGLTTENSAGYQNQRISSDYSSPTKDQTAPLWQSVYVIAPLFAAVFLLLVGVLIVALNSGERDKPINTEISQEAPEEDNRRRSPRNRNSANENNDADEPPANRRRPESDSGNSNENSGSEPTNSNQGGVTSEQEKVEGLALQFLRRISGNQNPVLSSGQVALINAKIKLLKNSVGFRENLRATAKNAANFEKMGQTHNLKGSFLAAAALAKLNNSRGDAVGTAAAMAPDLQKYSLVLGNEMANDNLLAIAAYAEGEPPNKIRDRVANLTLKPGANATTVRTIWFLHENGKLSAEAFDFAVRFVAAGTLLQNPTAFNL